MRVLFLGSSASPLVAFLRSEGHDVLSTDKKLEYAPQNLDFLVSYNYRHILKRPVLESFPHRAINLHISLLPWNRGADPSFWSYFDDTPKGATIHFIDEGIDTGDVLVQEEIKPTYRDSLEESYTALQNKIQGLFIRNWAAIRLEKIVSRSQAKNSGSIHRKVDLTPHKAFLEKKGWKTLTGEVRDYGIAFRTNSAIR